MQNHHRSEWSDFHIAEISRLSRAPPVAPFKPGDHLSFGWNWTALVRPQTGAVPFDRQRVDAKLSLTRVALNSLRVFEKVASLKSF
jgi:hypothetical protein